MDCAVLKKKLRSYITPGGQFRGVIDEILFELLCGWESWTGSAADFQLAVGVSQRQLATLVGKAKKLKRDGHSGNEHFCEVKVEGEVPPTSEASLRHGCIELDWDGGKCIRFAQVTQLVEFIKKAG
jgi:hypothetical protein